MLRTARGLALPCQVACGTLAVPCEWSIGPAQHCSRIVATCPHVLHALNVLSVRTSCRRCVGRLARLFFMLEAHNPQGAAEHAETPLEPSQ
jgi:hypothetical protein